VGDDYNDDKGAAAIRALFALGLFKDVRLEATGNVLVVVVEERPTIADVEFAGTKEFDKEALKKSMRDDAGLTEGRPYDKALADRAEQELKRQYINRSLYGAEVVTTVTPIERNRVNLTFTVTEGEPARIKECASWATRLSASPRSRTCSTRTPAAGCPGTPSRPLLARQAQCRPGDAAFLLSAARLPRVSRRLHPGGHLARQAGHFHHRQCHRRRALCGVGSQAGRQLPGIGRRVQVAGRHPPGEPYNADQVTETTKAFTEYFGDFGFAFARVEAVPDIDRENNRVSLVLQADPSRRATCAASM
jgi:outer membrane protein insertion porin family